LWHLKTVSPHAFPSPKGEGFVEIFRDALVVYHESTNPTLMKKMLMIAALLCSMQAFCQGQFQKETTGSLGFVSGHVMQLAQAIPADKYAWKPQDGVRSVAQVCAHIISANYFFASKLGAKIPEGVNMETLETNLKTKDAIAAELKRSYDVVTNAIKNTPDASLATKVEFPFPGEFTNMSAILIVLAHSNEHLGQLIAYARMNKISPPWSEGK
jgi:uncharacterized damage-inducible protein DinB